MTTSQIIWTIVIVVAALLLIALIVASMRKKSLADDRARAAQLRDSADTRAAGLPDADVRAQQAEADADRARLEAQRAEEQAATARAEVDQQQALQEDRIRDADRLDPDVDHRADDYTPQVGTPHGPTRSAGAPSDPDTILDADDPAAGHRPGDTHQT